MAAAAGKRIFGFLLLLATASGLQAQTERPLPERLISISAHQENLEAVLTNVARQGGFNFSYSPEAIDVKRKVSLRMQNKTVREVLDLIFGDAVSFKVKGNYLILLKSEKEEKKTAPSFYFISGYITDGASGEKIQEASVYEKKSQSSAVTSPYGYYSIRMDAKEESAQLIVNKNRFRDTVIYFRQSGNTTINITIFPEEQKLPAADSLALADSAMRADQQIFINFLLSEEQKANARNVKDTMVKKFQVSVLPFIGTNKRLSGNTVNDYSLNVLAGYSMGARKLEVGGIVNIDRDSVKNWQIAGMVNLAGGPVNGVQVAGMINANKSTTSGLQAAGLINSALDTVRGVQLAGLVNADFASVSGVAAAGLANFVVREAKGVQVAGLLNASLGNVEGVQIGGLANVCWKDMDGTQVSGLVNFARNVSGAQFGFLNISDSCKGVPVGFMSVVNKGYHKLEISTDEIFHVNLAFRTGVRKFYNILQAGIAVDSIKPALWHFGYGIGTSVSLGKKWFMNFDLTTQQIVNGPRFYEMNMLNKFHLTAEKQFTRNTAVAFGPVLNIYTSTVTEPFYESVFDKLPPYTFIDEEYSNGLSVKMWVGGRLALRFF